MLLNPFDMLDEMGKSEEDTYYSPGAVTMNTTVGGWKNEHDAWGKRHLAKVAAVRPQSLRGREGEGRQSGGLLVCKMSDFPLDSVYMYMLS